MTNIDQFESVFKAAAKIVFKHTSIDFQEILVVTDRVGPDVKAFGNKVRSFLEVFGDRRNLTWRDVSGDEFQTVENLLHLVLNEAPDLICTYRNLHSTAWRWPYSLGSHLDVLTQHTAVPVMVMPHPEAGRSLDHAIQNTDSVMAITNHLLGDQTLVNYAVELTQRDGMLYLTHIEDRDTFERYMDAISKIPSIDTESAREEIEKKLLNEAHDYVRSCQEALEKEKFPVRIKEVVTMGTRIEDYKKLIQDHEVDLLIMHTRDQDQLAMHGMAYPLAVELREIPILLI